MSWLGDTVALYGRVFRQAATLAVRSWILVVALVGYTYLLVLAGVLAAPLGLLGGFVQTVVAAACGSSWLALLERTIRYGRADPSDVPGSFVAYLGDVLTVSFLLWVLSMVAALALAPWPFLQIVFALATLTFFNAVPELIYLGRHAAAELLVASYRFVGENWIEWFPATVAVVIAAAVVHQTVPPGPLGLLATAALAAVIAYGGIVRGLLFLELTSSGRRARAFQRRAAG